VKLRRVAAGVGAVALVTVTVGALNPTSADAIGFIPTNLTASPMVLQHGGLPTPNGNHLVTTLKAGTLPVAGMTVSYSAGPYHLCSAVTNSQGVADCVEPSGGLLVLAYGGYNAAFAGTFVYEPSSAHGGLIS
jgi:hypothetical protein